MIRVASILLVSALAISGTTTPPPPFFHPHFQKKIECNLSRSGPKITVMFQTATYRRKDAENMKAGDVWHLAGAGIELSDKMNIGGKDVPAGSYSLKVRKTKKAWELVIDSTKRFSRKLSDEPFVFATTFEAKSALFEHLSIDVHPSGTKDAPAMHLDVRFDTNLARCDIALPKPKPRTGRRRR